MLADQLRTRVFTLCRMTDHTLGDLAQELALHPKVLSRKLNESASARLTLAERKRLIMTLARWQALTTQQEAHALMELLELPPATFSLTEWAAAPLALLEATVERAAPAAYPASQTVLPRYNLPAPMTRLIGREWAVEQVRQLLQQPPVRLVTLLGPGGTGKTSLALAVARALASERADTVAFVPLAGVTDPTLVVPAIAQTLRVKDVSDTPPLAQLITFLRAKELLLVLDNCEQVPEAAAEIGELLVQVPGLTVLATSRAPLQLYGEQEWSVPPLAVPNVQYLPLNIDLLQQFTAVQLFMERAEAVQAPFKLSPALAPVIAAICARLDGLPLAIELAAARTKLLTPAAILEQLMAGNWSVLDSAARNLPARHQTMQGVIGWSYDLLDGAEQALFRRLGVFVGGWTLDAVEAIWGRDDAGQLLGRLVDQSLVVVERDVATAGRYRLLEPIRQFALERLDLMGEAAVTRTQHAQYFVALAETAQPELIGPHQQTWFQRLELEHDNLRAALTWSLASHAGELPVRLAGALWRFWNVRGYFSEGRRWLKQTLAVPVEQYSPARIEVLKGAGNLASRQGEYRTAQVFHKAVFELFQALGDRLGMAHMLNNLGCEALELGELAYAEEVWQESLRVYRTFGDQRDLGNVLDNLGELAQLRGDYGEARRLHEESLALHRVVGDVRGIAVNFNNLGNTLCAVGDYAGAAAFFRESLLLCEGLGEKGVMVHSIEGQAMVVAAAGNGVKAAQLWGAAAALRDDLGVPATPSSRAQQGREQRRVRDNIGDEAWSGAWQKGREMPLEHAVATVLNLEPINN